jgi:hypothetical protein
LAQHKGNTFFAACFVKIPVIRIRIDFVRLDPYPGGQKLPTKIEKKNWNFMFWSAGRSFLKAEGFSCSLYVLFGRPKDKQIAIFDQKNIVFSAVNFFQFLVIKTLDLDPDPHSPKMLDPDPLEISADPKHCKILLILSWILLFTEVSSKRIFAEIHQKWLHCINKLFPLSTDVDYGKHLKITVKMALA